jgi:hypothetical protein
MKAAGLALGQDVSTDRATTCASTSSKKSTDLREIAISPIGDDHRGARQALEWATQNSQAYCVTVFSVCGVRTFAELIVQSQRRSLAV